MKSWAPMAFAARSMSAREAPGRPMAMLSATVPEKRNASCVTVTTPRRSSSPASSVSGTPSSRTRPSVGS